MQPLYEKNYFKRPLAKLFTSFFSVAYKLAYLHKLKIVFFFTNGKFSKFAVQYHEVCTPLGNGMWFVNCRVIAKNALNITKIMQVNTYARARAVEIYFK